MRNSIGVRPAVILDTLGKEEHLVGVLLKGIVTPKILMITVLVGYQ